MTLRGGLTASASIIAACVLTAAALAHDGVHHATPDEARAHEAVAAETLAADTPGFPAIKGGDYTLVTHDGVTRTSRDPDGRFQLVFFGYAHCKAICSVALPRMAETVDLLAAGGLAVTPLLITVDPQRDTVEHLAAAVPKIHARMIGLTGDPARLEEAYRAFQVERSIVFTDPDSGPVYAHGSYIFLLGPDGAFKTILPPILAPERMAELVRKYVSGGNKPIKVEPAPAPSLTPHRAGPPSTASP